MIEKVILDHLSNTLEPGVYTEVPAGPVDTFVVLQKTGSSRQDHICHATVSVQSYAPSMYAAAALNERVKAAMDGLTDLDEVCRSELNSDYNFTDTASKRHRYQAVYDISHY